MGLFWFIALAGFVLSVFTHISTFFGFDPQKVIPAFALFAGLFVIIIAAAISQKSSWTEPGRSKFKGKNLAPYAPLWMQKAFVIIFLYGLINLVFIAHFRLHDGSPTEISPGIYTLQSHGLPIRTLTAREYHDFSLYPLRIFSGGWMIAYFMAWMTLESARREAASAKPTEELA